MPAQFARQPLARPSGDAIPKRALTFFTAAAILISCFVTSAAPIPLMSVWTETLGLDNGAIAMTVVWYFVGCILTLVFFARLSNFLGRRPVVWITLAWAALACWLLADCSSVAALNTARFFQGLACGLASSAAMAWVVDTAPPKRPWLGTALTAAGPNIGLSLGTLLAGLLPQLGLLSAEQLFYAYIALLAAAALLCALSTETMAFATESLAAVLVPKVAMPKRLMRLFFIAAFGFVGTWGLGSFFQGFSARLAGIVFEGSGTLLAGLVYLCLIIPNATMGLCIGRFSPTKVLPALIVIFFAAVVCAFGALHFGHPLLFLAAVALTGAMSGATCSSGLKMLLLDASLKERAGVIAALYLTAYIGSGVPNFVVGRLAQNASMDAISMGYIAWAAAAAIGVTGLLALMKRRPSAAEKLRLVA